MPHRSGGGGGGIEMWRAEAAAARRRRRRERRFGGGVRRDRRFRHVAGGHRRTRARRRRRRLRERRSTIFFSVSENESAFAEVRSDAARECPAGRFVERRVRPAGPSSLGAAPRPRRAPRRHARFELRRADAYARVVESAECYSLRGDRKAYPRGSSLAPFGRLGRRAGRKTLATPRARLRRTSQEDPAASWNADARLLSLPTSCAKSRKETVSSVSVSPKRRCPPSDGSRDVVHVCGAGEHRTGFHRTTGRRRGSAVEAWTSCDAPALGKPRPAAARPIDARTACTQACAASSALGRLRTLSCRNGVDSSPCTVSGRSNF